jgi:hypothetical protein
VRWIAAAIALLIGLAKPAAAEPAPQPTAAKSLAGLGDAEFALVREAGGRRFWMPRPLVR